MSFNVVLLGPPGSGKGTQASRLADFLFSQKISTGDLIREQIAQGSDMGLKVKSLVMSGELVPDQLVCDIFISAAMSLPNGFIADGFPRTLIQAQQLDLWAKEQLKTIDFIFFLDLQLEFLLDRLLGRRVCSECHRTFHIRLNPPRVSGVCDFDGKDLMQRVDDEESVIRNRFLVYQKEIEPVLSYYGNRVIRVDAMQSVDLLFSHLVKYLT